MNLHGWDYYELGNEIHSSSLFELFTMYKREQEKYRVKCLERYQNGDNLSDQGKKNLEAECDFIEGAEIKIALEIANRLTKEEANK